MHRGGARIGARKGIRAEPIARRRILRVDPEHGFEVASRLVAPAGSAGALPFGKVLLDRHRLAHDQLGELGEVDVAAGDDADDRPIERLDSLSAAASASAPAPSAIVRDFSAISRIASAVCLSVTVIAPSVTGRIRCHMRSVTLWPPAPSTKLACQSVNFCGPPSRSDSA